GEQSQDGGHVAGALEDQGHDRARHGGGDPKGNQHHGANEASPEELDVEGGRDRQADADLQNQREQSDDDGVDDRVPEDGVLEDRLIAVEGAEPRLGSAERKTERVEDRSDRQDGDVGNQRQDEDDLEGVPAEPRGGARLSLGT